MSNVFLKPAPVAEGSPARIVRDPVSFQPLSAEGEWKPLSSFWARRLRDVDVIDATPVPEKAARKPKPPADPLHK